MKLINTFLALTLALSSISCQKQENDRRTKQSQKKNLIILKPEQMDLMDIELGEIKEMIITPIVYANGRIISNPESHASVSTQISGKIEQIFLKEGDWVRKNQAIASLSSLELINMQQEYYTTLSEMEFAKAELHRQRSLNSQKVGALVDLQLTESKYNSLKAKTYALKEKLKMLGINPTSDSSKVEALSPRILLTSPINGYITKLPIHLGKHLQANELAATVVNNEKLRAEIYCYERDISMIYEGMPIEIEFANLSIPKVMGVVESISQRVDEENKSLKVYANFQNPTGHKVIPQMSIYAKVESRRSDKKVKTVPLTAIYEEDNVNYLFHTSGEKNDGKELYFKKSKVIVISSDGNNAEIRLTEELPPATKIVIHNTFAMEIESRKAGL